MSRKKKLFGILGLVVIIGVGYFFYQKKYAECPGGEGPPIFHPDSVVYYNWRVNSDDFTFARKDRFQEWYPKYPPKVAPQNNIQIALNVISEAYQKEIKPLKNKIVEVFLKLDNSEEWVGTWDGRFFRWDKGPKAGYGRCLSPKEAQIFTAGKMAFVEKKINWCPDRFNKITLNNGDNKKEIAQEGPEWVLSGYKVDATAIEKWMGENCLFMTNNFVDKDLMPKSTEEFTLSFTFKEADPVNFTVLDNSVIKFKQHDEEKYLYSDQLYQNLQQLHKLF